MDRILDFAHVLLAFKRMFDFTDKFFLLFFHFVLLLSLVLLLNGHKLIFNVVVIFVHVLIIQEDDVVLTIVVHRLLRASIRPFVVLLHIHRVVFFTIVVEKIFDFFDRHRFIDNIFRLVFEIQKASKPTFYNLNLFYVILYHIVVILLENHDNLVSCVLVESGQILVGVLFYDFVA